MGVNNNNQERKRKKMKLKELFDLVDTHKLEPSSGDPAYAYYRGQKYKGRLILASEEDAVYDRPVAIVWDNPIPDQPYTGNYINVGSDDSSCTFDKSEGAWRVIADLD
jgi:hypothetical protein